MTFAKNKKKLSFYYLRSVLWKLCGMWKTEANLYKINIFERQLCRDKRQFWMLPFLYVFSSLHRCGYTWQLESVDSVSSSVWEELSKFVELSDFWHHNQAFQDVTGQIVWHGGENKDDCLVLCRQYSESDGCQTPQEDQGCAEGNCHQQGSARAGHSAAGGVKCRTGEPAPPILDCPPIQNCHRVEEWGCWRIKHIGEDHPDCLPEEAGHALPLHRQETAPHWENAQEMIAFCKKHPAWTEA